VNHFAVYLALGQQALGSGPAGNDTHTVCQGSSAVISTLFGVLCLIQLTLPAVCCYSFASASLWCASVRKEIHERVKELFLLFTLMV